ncbi:hypothetical protein TL16_g04000 [Triparma laevis f. inornata]|uniref:Phosphoglycerate mutase-like protein n=1 Tax=Triparma laevis f. inornata TaxID=1714386 RepID=A0A9W7E1J2_9STRA|nr:hypothetical protein TL16_g04000 [Triparma laevis f. inornata]
MCDTVKVRKSAKERAKCRAGNALIGSPLVTILEAINSNSSLRSSLRSSARRKTLGFHNLLADSYRSEGKTWTQYTTHPSNPYVKPEITDAPLTHKGRLQATSLQPLTSTLPIDLVVVSPQNRATHTALLAFSHLIPSTISSGKPLVPFLAYEGVREETGVHVCDMRRSITEAKKEFPYIDYSLIKSDLDPMFMTDRRETKEEIGGRIYDFLMWLKEREEQNVAVASHSGWLMTVFNGVVLSTEELLPWFQTGELRSVKLEWRVKN